MSQSRILTKMKATYIPLTELHDSPDIRWRVNAAFESYAPLDQIGLNVAAIRGIAHAAGYYPEITVATPDRIASAVRKPIEQPETDDEQKRFSVRISGINPDGTATGSAGMTRRKPPNLSNFASGNTSFDPNRSSHDDTFLQQRHVLRIGLDVEHITQTIEAQRTLRDPNAWSRIISKTLRGQLLEATNSTIKGNVTGLSGMVAGYTVGTVIGTGNLNLFAPSEHIDMVMHGVCITSIAAIASMRHLTNRNPDLYTGFMPFRVDQWARAQARARTTRLTKAIPATA